VVKKKVATIAGVVEDKVTVVLRSDGEIDAASSSSFVEAKANSKADSKADSRTGVGVGGETTIVDVTVQVEDVDAGGSHSLGTNAARLMDKLESVEENIAILQSIQEADVEENGKSFIEDGADLSISTVELGQIHEGRSIRKVEQDQLPQKPMRVPRFQGEALSVDETHPFVAPISATDEGLLQKFGVARSRLPRGTLVIKGPLPEGIVSIFENEIARIAAAADPPIAEAKVKVISITMKTPGKEEIDKLKLISSAMLELKAAARGAVGERGTVLPDPEMEILYQSFASVVQTVTMQAANPSSELFKGTLKKYMWPRKRHRYSTITPGLMPTPWNGNRLGKSTASSNTDEAPENIIRRLSLQSIEYGLLRTRVARLNAWASSNIDPLNQYSGGATKDLHWIYSALDQVRQETDESTMNVTNPGSLPSSAKIDHIQEILNHVRSRIDTADVLHEAKEDDEVREKKYKQDAFSPATDHPLVDAQLPRHPCVEYTLSVPKVVGSAYSMSEVEKLKEDHYYQIRRAISFAAAETAAQERRADHLAFGPDDVVISKFTVSEASWRDVIDETKKNGAQQFENLAGSLMGHLGDLVNYEIHFDVLAMVPSGQDEEEASQADDEGKFEIEQTRAKLLFDVLDSKAAKRAMVRHLESDAGIAGMWQATVTGNDVQRRGERESIADEHAGSMEILTESGAIHDIKWRRIDNGEGHTRTGWGDKDHPGFIPLPHTVAARHLENHDPTSANRGHFVATHEDNEAMWGEKPIDWTDNTHHTDTKGRTQDR